MPMLRIAINPRHEDSGNLLGSYAFGPTNLTPLPRLLSPIDVAMPETIDVAQARQRFASA
jgi:hypothetical protein